MQNQMHQKRLVFRVGQRIVSLSDLHEIGWGIRQRTGCENVRVDGPLPSVEKSSTRMISARRFLGLVFMTEWTVLSRVDQASL
jgi:hypothetical protein